MNDEDGKCMEIQGSQYGYRYPLSFGLEELPLFSGIDIEELGRMARTMRYERWPPGYHFKHQDQIAQRFYILLCGRVKAIRCDAENGRELTLFLFGPGDCFDDFNLLDGKSIHDDLHYCTLDEVEVLSASLEHWHRWLQTHASLRHEVGKIALRQMERLRDLAGELVFDDIQTRLVHLLLRHFDTKSYGLGLIDNLSQEELASLVGSVRPVVARVLGELRRDGVIESRNGKICIASYQRLLALVEKNELSPL